MEIVIYICSHISDSKVHGANMGLTWVLSAPDGLHVGPMNLAIRDCMSVVPEAGIKGKDK